MGRFGAYWAGFATVPAVVLVGLAVLDGIEPGLQIECRGLRPEGGICLFDTGPIDTTPRAVARLRWRWHRYVIHRKRGG